MTHPKDHEALTRLRANLASSNIDAHSGLLIQIRPDDIRTALDLITRLEATPPGMVLVPIEPTEAMLKAACGEGVEHPLIKYLTSEERSGWGIMPLAHYRAMLAASQPKDPS